MSQEAIDKLWKDNHVHEQWAAGLDVEILTPPTEASDPRYAGEFGQSVILKTKPPESRHVGTLHRMIDRDGNVLDHAGYRHLPHPKQYREPDGTLYRVLEGQEKRPQPRQRRQRQRPTK